MASKIRLRAKAKGEMVQVKALIKHPMETGGRKNKKGVKIPAHYIQTISAKVGEKTVFQAYWSTAISTNPYVAFEYAGSKGDQIKIHAVDNKQEEYVGETKVK